MTEVKKNYSSFKDLNIKIIALSVDSPEQSAAFKKEMELPFDLLCDVKRQVVKLYHLLNPHEHKGIAYPAIFIIKNSGEIGYRSLDRKASRVNLSDVLSYLKKLLENPGFQWSSVAKKETIIPSVGNIYQITRNLIFRGNRDDWIHYVTYPYQVVRGLFVKNNLP